VSWCIGGAACDAFFSTQGAQSASRAGFASTLMEAAVRWASREGLVVIPGFSYARHWLRNNEKLTAEASATAWVRLVR
jgi:GNAT superfamily N-acetyltransferase